MHSRTSLVRSLGACIGVCVGVTLLKLWLGHGVGREAPFALFGLAIILAGWLGDARSAFVATAVLSVSWWYFFFEPYQAFTLAGPWTVMQLVVLLSEGVAIGLVLSQMERARNLVQLEMERSQKLSRKLIDLDGLSTALSQALTRDDVARIVVERGMAAAHADTCTLYVLDEPGQGLDLIANRGIAPEVLPHVRRLTAGTPAFDGLSSGQPRWAESFQDYRAFAPALADIRTRGPRASAFWSVPLVTEGKATGLLGMGFFEPRRFPAEERMFVETFARHCAEALRRADRLEAERCARALAERLQNSLLTTLRSIGDAVIATDAAGNVTFVNPIAEKLTGWLDSEARGHPLREVFRIINEESRAEVATPVERVLREGIVVGLANHTLLVSRDGQKHTPIDDSGAPIRGESGQIDGVVLVFRDVSAKKKEEAQLGFLWEATRTLSESLDYQATLARVARLAVPHFADWVAVDLLGEGEAHAKRLAVTHVDPAKLELANEIEAKYPPDQKAARGVASVLRTGRSELYPEITLEMLEAGSQNEEHLRLNLALALCSAMVVPLIARGQTLGVMTFAAAESGHRYGPSDLQFAEELCRRCALAIDNARLFSAEQQARSSADLANRAKDEFLATVSHELRTPLNAIMGWARLLSAGGLEPGKHERGLQTIERNAVAMARLIEDILDVSRIISGKMRVDLQVVDLAQVIESAIESVRPAAEAKCVQVVAKLDPTAGPILGDPTRVQQVIWNLLSNAVKFNVKDGKVEVSLRRTDSTIEICVSDTGKGIEPGFLPQVFDAFRQAESGYARGRSGLGLGLAIAKQLTDLHGGRIEASSEGAGKGATFRVQFPAPAITRSSEFQRSSAPRRIRSESKIEAPALALRGLRVLVVDDDEDARSLVRAVLEACGSSVLTASSAAEGLSALDRERPDVLISDIGMPGEDGYDLIRRVRALPSARGGDIPAAALTAFARAEDRGRVLSAGYSAHIPKPVEPAELVAAVASLTLARAAASVVRDN